MHDTEKVGNTQQSLQVVLDSAKLPHKMQQSFSPVRSISARPDHFAFSLCWQLLRT